MKHILVHLDASARSADRLTLAQGLAREHQAALTALYAVVPTLLALPFAGAAGAESAYAVFEQLDREQRGRARALFERQLPSGIMAWAETGDELFESTVLQHALLADLLVLGCYGHNRLREWVLGGATRTVLDSMTLPVLMAH